MSEMVTTGVKYVCLRRGDVYHFLAQRPDNMSEDAWDGIAALIADAIQTKINGSSRARDLLKRIDLSASVKISLPEPEQL